MRGVFGMLLIGGGIVLLFGELTGRITFPFSPAQPTTVSTSNTASGTSAPGNTQQQTANRLININK
jgi:hypothetical protein